VIEQIQAQFPSVQVAEGKWGPEVRVPAADLLVVARWVKAQGFVFPNCVSAVDRLEEGFEVYTHLFSPDTGGKITLVVKAPAENPTVPSLTPVWAGLNWYEREAFDLVGVRFEGHPDLRRILTSDDFGDMHPLQKKYSGKGKLLKSEELPKMVRGGHGSS